MKYPLEAKVVSLLFSSSLMHLIHFNSILLMSLAYFDAPLKMSCIIPCLCIMPCYWLSVSLVVCLLLLDRRRRWYRRSLRLRFSGVSSTPGCWVSRQVFTHMNHCSRSSLVTDSSVVFSASLTIRCLSRSHHMSSCSHEYSLTPTPTTLLFVGLCRSIMLRFVCARVLLSLILSPV